MQRTFVISLGGSLIVPQDVDTAFLSSFKDAISDHLQKTDDRIIFVAGGGATARKYQRALLQIRPDASYEELDVIGIAATRINALIVNSIFGCENGIVTDLEANDIPFSGRILVASGWKPGFSTDMDTVILAKRFNADLCVNLSNTDMVFSSDPKKDPNAKPICDITWDVFLRDVIPDKWTPGVNCPFDPVASRFARDNKLSVVCANGRNIENFIRILEGDERFIGTRIHP